MLTLSCLYLSTSESEYYYVYFLLVLTNSTCRYIQYLQCCLQVIELFISIYVWEYIQYLQHCLQLQHQTQIIHLSIITTGRCQMSI